MKLIPENGRVVVKRLDAETVTPGGIVLPDNAQKKSQKGEVLAVNSYRNKDGKTVEPLFSVGDTVLFGLYAGEEFVLPDGEKVLFIQEDSILGRFVG